MFGQATDQDINEDTLLEDEDLFEGPVSPNELPELRGDVKIIASIESELSGIQYLLKDIKSLGGMNQQIALEAAAYSDDIKNTNINFFTKEPTTTKLTFTQESLVESIRRGFIKIYEKIREWIKKLVAWFTGIYKNTVSDREYEKAKQQVEINEEKTDKAWSVIIDHLNKANEELRSVDKEPEFLSQIIPTGEIPDVFRFTVNVLFENPNYPINRVLKGDDPFIHDIILMGPYIRLIKDLIEKIPSVNLQLVDKIKKINQVYLEEAQGDHGESYRLNSLRTLKEVEEPVYYFINNKKITSQEMINQINTLRTRTRENRGDTSIQFPELVLRLFTNTNELNIRQMSRMHSKSISDMIRLEQGIADLQSLEQKIEYGDYNSKGNDNLISNYRTAVAKVSYEINYVAIILRYIKNTLDQIFYMSRETVHFSDNLLDFMVTKARKESVNVPNTVLEAMQQMKRRRNQNYTVYITYSTSKPM